MRTLLAHLVALLAVAAASAGGQNAAGGAQAIVCPAKTGDAVPPDFASPACRRLPLSRIDPQGRLIWVRMEIPVGAAMIDRAEPLGIFLSAKASSELWLNGVFIGANGRPAATAAEEIPGRMDAVFPVPPVVRRPGLVRLDLRMSAHHGFLDLARPFHGVGIAPYEPPQFRRLVYYWPALVTFGALLVGGLYFAAMGIGREGRRGAVLLSAMALFAAAQLFAEASRGLFAYSYPTHDVRLILIFVFSLGFGLSLAATILSRFEPRPGAPLLAIALGTIALAALVSGFDNKTAIAILVPALACAVLAVRWTLQKRPKAAQYLAALLGFILLIVAAPVLFLDLLFYLAVAAFLLFLFVQQALLLREERRLRRCEAERAGRLAMALEQREAPANTAIAVASTGRTERIPLADITYIRGAGDYVELCLADGREVLHADTLNALEESFPATFVRVHRSHIVNTAHVRALEREPTGTGRLHLTNGAQVPVSRRVLPSVRAALDE